MKNNRKIEVGQVRMCTCVIDKGNPVTELYHICSVSERFVEVVVLDGSRKGKRMVWRQGLLTNDIVVM